MKKKILIIVSIIALIVLILALHYLDISQNRDLPEEETIQIEQKLEEKTAKQKIDNLIQIITSSPKESSNVNDYISEHEQEFNEIVDMDTEALKILFAKFEEGTEGLEGLIIQKACSKILGGEDIKTAFTTGQEWYEAYKNYVFRIRDLNSNEFIQEHSPKSYVLIELLEL